jgi:hypothetical protein
MPPIVWKKAPKAERAPKVVRVRAPKPAREPKAARSKRKLGQA